MSKKNEPTRPQTVPTTAVWNAGENEWELGEKNAKESEIGEWKWWLAPLGHLVCHTFFDGRGNMIRSTRFHPNGEVSREVDVAAASDTYYRSTAATTENFAYGNEKKNVWKAVKRKGVPVSFDHFDRDGKHLNPPIEAVELQAEPPAFDVSKIKQVIKLSSKSYLAGELDASFAKKVLKLIGNVGETTPLVEAHLGELDLDEAGDTVFYEGNLEIEDLSDWEGLGIANLIVNGNLTVKNAIVTSEDPSTMLVVNGDVRAANIVSSGGLVVTGNLHVDGCLFGDYNHGSAFVRGNATANFFHPDEYFFEVTGKTDFKIAFGNAYRLNENERPEAMNYNERTARDFFAHLHESVRKQMDVSVETELDANCEDGAVWAYLDRYAFMKYCLTGHPVFAQK
jgi:hypothetical protein